MQLHIFSLSQIRVLQLITKKNRVLLKKGGVLLGLKISDFGLKSGDFFRPKSAKRGCFSNLGTSVVYALVRSRGGGGGGGGAVSYA